MLLVSGLSYTINIDLTNALTASLFVSCTANGGITKSNNFELKINCLKATCAQDSSYFLTGTANKEYNAFLH